MLGARLSGSGARKTSVGSTRTRRPPNRSPVSFRTNIWESREPEVTDNDPALNVQNGFFNQARKNHARIAIVLTSGQRISGVVKALDKYTLLLDTRGGEQVVFKH